MRFFVIFLLIACNSTDKSILIKNTGKAQGSFYHIKYISKLGVDYHNNIDSILISIDNSLSIYNPNSLISELNNQSKIKPDKFLKDVFLSAKQIHTETNGLFDCSVYPIVDLWGFYKKSFSDSISIDSSEVANLLKYVGFDKIDIQDDSLQLLSGMSLDFNSIAQGYTIDVIANFLFNKGVDDFLIELGGEVLAKGNNINNKRWVVGVDKPTEVINKDNRFQFILNLEDKALATSGNYRNYYILDNIKYAHTINPSTGFPAKNRLLSVTVLHDDCMLADAYATAFMVMGVDKTQKFIKERDDIDVYLIYTDNNNNWKFFLTSGIEKLIIN
tara:strand:+ start:5600 stop:6589 length:990 start_codon:yes stop_codon:yes gene_type:complete